MLPTSPLDFGPGPPRTPFVDRETKGGSTSGLLPIADYTGKSQSLVTGSPARTYGTTISGIMGVKSPKARPCCCR